MNNFNNINFYRQYGRILPKRPLLETLTHNPHYMDMQVTKTKDPAKIKNILMQGSENEFINNLKMILDYYREFYDNKVGFRKILRFEIQNFTRLRHQVWDNLSLSEKGKLVQLARAMDKYWQW